MFDILFLEQAANFLDEIENKARTKILFNLKKAQLKNDPELFKKLKGTDIWEFRTLFEKKQYRILAFWDKRDNKNTLVICSNGFIKKTDKTPKTEIEKSELLRQKYFNQ